MNRADVLAWLDNRRPVPPAGVLAHVVGALRDAPGVSLAEQLTVAAGDLARRIAAASPGGRELALDLLAADALVTYAFEAQAETDPAGLARLAGRVAAGTP